MLPKPAFLSPLIFLMMLGAAQAITAQQAQGYPKWFPASPIGVQTSSAPAA
ncbi:MAG: hypothetical protein ABSG62_20710 [Terracidiphilus sp.]|jgi:hypothetical protein